MITNEWLPSFPLLWFHHPILPPSPCGTNVYCGGAKWCLHWPHGQEGVPFAGQQGLAGWCPACSRHRALSAEVLVHHTSLASQLPANGSRQDSRELESGISHTSSQQKEQKMPSRCLQTAWKPTFSCLRQLRVLTWAGQSHFAILGQVLSQKATNECVGISCLQRSCQQKHPVKHQVFKLLPFSISKWLSCFLREQLMKWRGALNLGYKKPSPRTYCLTGKDGDFDRA